MEPAATPRSPWAYFGLWLPAVTVAGFLLADAIGVVAVPSAVLAVTFAAALGWVAVGFGGSRTEPDFSLRGRNDDGGRQAVADPDADASADRRSRPLGSVLLVYLTATTVLGWLAVAATT